MEVLSIGASYSSLSSFQFKMVPTRVVTTQLHKPTKNLRFYQRPTSSFSSNHKDKVEFKLFTATSPTVSTEFTDPHEQEVEIQSQEEKFDWYAQWYPVMPVCDLDKRAPHAKKVIGLDIVVWWDRNESSWKVFDDSCPHRLAPLSEGRIDQWGRLQCVYHGWCFSGSGDCKLIPQLPPDGPPVHTFKKACVAVYPSTTQNGIVWFWPNADPQYKDILDRKKPPYIPELDDPSYTKMMGNRDMPYGYEVLIENLMDPAHVPYAHHGILQIPKRKKSDKVDREGGRPLELTIQKLDINGFTAKQEWANSKFFAPCVFYAFPPLATDQSNGSVSSAGTIEERPVFTPQRRAVQIFICIPVSPGNSRLIWTFPKNFGHWIDRIVPRWIFHMALNLVFDSDLYLLHVEERKIKDIGPQNWQKACFLPTKSDSVVVGFRRWLNKYSDGLVGWRNFSGVLPPTPPRQQLMDRYWSHVMNCSSCKMAHRGLSALEIVLQVGAIVAIGVVAAAKQGTLSAAARNTVVASSVICFVASRWLSHFVKKIFHFHDYSHAFR
ncbi:protochlorophyllide-dependent translocon component 52, chloroplastic-like [Diospyros lotus]|uniref:protochlorophyllide-dependent translocon component 52, chloroplastic-like n=1 Tax=Diospyros lotus TaxID=55363 RepID=UPI0022565468|nr:protochlorophyllide-dependent translocon component 52, chloroplastic-like [Diospyros lotus]